MHFLVQSLGSKPVRVALVRRCGVLHYVFCLKGRRFRGSTGEAGETAARGVAREAVQRAMQAAPGAPLLLADAIADYLETKWPDGGETRKSSEGRLERFKAFAGELDLSATSGDILTQRVQAFLDEGQAKHKRAPQTLRNDQLVLSAFCSWLLRSRTGRIPWRYNPASRKLLTLPAVQAPSHAEIPATALDDLLRAGRTFEVWPVIVLCLGAGLRPRGAAKRRWDEIDLEARTITVTEKKRTRIVPLGEWACLELTAWREAHKADEAVYPFHHDTAFDQIRQIRKAAGLPDSVTLQALRRAAANRLIDSVEPRIYSLVMGHSLEVAQKHYLLRTSAKAHAAVNEALDFRERPKSLPQKLPQKRKRIRP